MDILIGFLLGIISSAIVVIMQLKVFVPKLLFANEISKSEGTDSNEKYAYRLKFRNNGYRDIIDLNIYAKIVFPELSGKASLFTADINVSYNFNPIFKKRGLGRNRNPDAIIRFILNDEFSTSEFSRPIYPEYIRSKALQKNLILEDILEVSSKSYLQVIIIAHDRFSGSKKAFESLRYSSKDIKHGIYEYGKLTIF